MKRFKTSLIVLIILTITFVSFLKKSSAISESSAIKNSANVINLSNSKTSAESIRKSSNIANIIYQINYIVKNPESIIKITGYNLFPILK